MPESTTSIGERARRTYDKLTGSGQELNPAEELLDLRLPKNFVEKLCGPLQALRFEILEKPIQERHGHDTRSCTVIRRGGVQRFLLHMPHKILNKYSRESRDALRSVPYVFEGTATILFVFSQLDSPQRILREIITEEWLARHKIKGKFVPWRDISDLESLPDDATRIRELKDILELGELPPFVAELHDDEVGRDEHTERLLERLSRRLQKLKEQEASMGIYTPAHVLTEIEDVEAQIKRLSQVRV